MTSCSVKFAGSAVVNDSVAVTRSAPLYDVFGLVGAGVLQTCVAMLSSVGPHENALNACPV